MLNRYASLFLILACFGTPSWAKDVREVLQSMTGCFYVDYNYSEVESLKSDYKRDSRIYEVNKDKSVKEWIYLEETNPKNLRLQHILFVTKLNGDLDESSLLKHQAEDWEAGAGFLYDFTGPLNWVVKPLEVNPETWVRKVTNLDDGPRYQCAAPWNLKSEYASWECDNYAPIPGRETRDMKRSDYQTLARSTRISVYGGSWLEKQSNVKTIHDASGKRTPLASEAGRNWYVKIPDSECTGAQKFVAPRQEFWKLLQETWAQVLSGKDNFVEKKTMIPRFVKMMQVEAKWKGQNLKDADIRRQAKEEILAVIRDHRGL